MSVFTPDTTPLSGEEVLKLRESTGLSQMDLGAETGIEPSSWGRWERNGCPPPWSFLVREYFDGAVDDISTKRLPAETVRDLVDLFGSAVAFANAIGVQKQTVYSWKSAGAPGQSGWGRALTIMAELNGLI